jgi:hypothetical protein
MSRGQFCLTGHLLPYKGNVKFELWEMNHGILEIEGTFEIQLNHFYK